MSKVKKGVRLENISKIYQDAKTKYMRAESQQIQSRYTYLFRKKILNFYRGMEL